MTFGGSQKPIRAVVVDDSVLIRTVLRSHLEADGDILVVGAASQPFEAREVIKSTNPDVVTLDVEMPGMNGLEFLEKIMTLRPMPVVMVSSLTHEGAEATLTALEGGAVDFIAKPAGDVKSADFGVAVRKKVRAAAKAKVRAKIPRSPQRRAQLRAGANASLIAIGASTGGVSAIGSIVERLPKGLPPIVATIHMPPHYTARFAQRLAKQTGHDVREATEGDVLNPGAILIAPGDQHMRLRRAGGGLAVTLGEDGPISGHRPSVDACFTSVAETVGKQALGIILTGMGRDGAAGLLKMRRAGAVCLGEAASSCVVYGMPRVAKEMGAVNEEHDLERIPDRIGELVAAAPVRA